MSDEIFITPDQCAEEFLRRAKLIQQLNKNLRLRAAYMQLYKLDCAAWINDWGITFDSRNVDPLPKLMPFVLFPRQKELVQFVLECLRDKQNGLIEKSRDMGATWLCCCISVWLWLFHSGSTVGWGSLLAHDLDDRGNPKSIFLKIRQIIDNLPPFMRPYGFDARLHAPSMKILHPSDTATIIGEGGDNMGRGGRTTIYFKDESAHYEHAELIEAALGDNTNVQIDISSVNGSANVFYRRRMAGEVWSPGCVIPRGRVRVFILDWSDHPNKTKRWHDEREETARREGLLHIFRQEVDRDYAGSIDRIIIQQEWVRAAVDAHKILGIKEDGAKVAAQDVADGGADKNALAIRHGIVLKYAEHWGGDAGEAAKFAVPRCIELGAMELQYDSIGVGVGYRVELVHMKDNNLLPKALKVVPWNAGASPLDPEKRVIPGDKESPTNEDQYLNLKAQSWFRLRSRFYKTFRAVKHGDVYPHDELISLDGSLPHLHDLMMQLSQPTHDSNGKGKTIVDKKPDGSLSPNLADAICMVYNPIKSPAKFFDL